MITGKAIRVAQGRFQSDIARGSGRVLSQFLISNFERRRINPTDIELAAWARALGFVGDPRHLLSPVDPDRFGLPDSAEARDGQRERGAK